MIALSKRVQSGNALSDRASSQQPASSQHALSSVGGGNVDFHSYLEFVYIPSDARERLLLLLLLLLLLQLLRKGPEAANCHSVNVT